MKTLEERFWKKVDKRGPDECWEWRRSKNPDGYGKVWLFNKMLYAHRISFEITYGKIPENMRVCHKCDNPGCVNPNHLFLGSQKDNMKDMILKGRAIHYCGEENKSSKLKSKEVCEIRKLYSMGEYSQRFLADKYNISQRTICDIVNNKKWKFIRDYK